MPSLKKKTVSRSSRPPAKTSTVRKTQKQTVLHLDVQSAVKRVGVPTNAKLQAWAQAAYLVHHAAHRGRRKSAITPVQVSLKLVGSAESRRLNLQWREQDHATNVLSFPAGEQFEFESVPSLGDLAICVPVVAREAKQQGITQQAHWAHLIIHGVLHLLGYDHEEVRDAAVMEACEVALLEQLGFANPYVLNEAL
jgi:probable rRNA maturation factor